MHIFSFFSFIYNTIYWTTYILTHVCVRLSQFITKLNNSLALQGTACYAGQLLALAAAWTVGQDMFGPSSNLRERIFFKYNF